jgi:uncharacterized membrane protein YkoI
MNRSYRPFPLVMMLIVAVYATAAMASKSAEAQLRAEATVSESAARATALAKVPKGRIASAELEEEHGKLIWSFDIAAPGTRNITEIQVDAKTGAIVSTQVESPRAEAIEAAAEAKVKK